MPKRVLIFDTSILCCLLRIPGKDRAGPTGDTWDHPRVQKIVDEETKTGSTFVLPMATIIETGNHVAQAPGDRFSIAKALTQLIADTARARSPWAAFSDQAELWRRDHITKLVDDWPTLAASGLTIGDATIKDVAEYYARTGFDVEIFTADAGLKAYQPSTPIPQPRRRR